MLKNLFDGKFDYWMRHDEQAHLKRMSSFLAVFSIRKQNCSRYHFSPRNHSRNLPLAMNRPDSLSFSGSFTPLHIQRLVWLQTISRMSDEDFSQVIGCSVLTLRNWKKGRSTSCQTHFIIPLRLLFRGELDEKLMAFQQPI